MRPHPIRRLSRLVRSTAVVGLLVLVADGIVAQEEGRTNQAAIEAMRSGAAETARDIWTELAEQGDAVAQSNLGGLLLSTTRGAPEYAQALSWFEKATEQDNAAALVSLGHLHRAGVSNVLAPDRAAAIGYFRRAAALGSAEGAYHFGALTLDAGSQDESRAAVEAIRDAAEAGFPPAMHRVGTFLETGTFTAPNLDSAIGWYEGAAKRGHVESVYVLGEIHMTGATGEVDMDAALALFERAAAEGHTGAQLAAGFLRLHGLVGAADPARAAEWFTRAAEQWDYRAMYHVGLQHLEGAGVEQDTVEAHKWFHLAASGGHLEAHYMRGAAAAALTAEEFSRAEDAAQTWFDANHDTPHTHDSLEPHAH